jgi:hypothetical protein
MSVHYFPYFHVDFCFTKSASRIIIPAKLVFSEAAMTEHITPQLAPELLKRIRLVRRDLGTLLFHFTRATNEGSVAWTNKHGDVHTLGSSSACAILKKILHEGRLIGTSRWTYGHNCVCFTEAPIHEFNSIFSLVELAASEKERPRYEPYGIAVNKNWFFAHGGRPVIYDHASAFEALPDDQKHRFVRYDPGEGIDFTWEREWRIRTDSLKLDPKETIVIVPTAEEAFDLVYQFANLEADYDEDGPSHAYHVAKWLAVSLDIFGFGR